MYFPYLRSKQFELIALRDINALISEKREKISPIIEPVKNSSTLFKTLREFKVSNINFSIIINPQVGDMQGMADNLLSLLNAELADYRNFQLGIILSGGDSYLKLIPLLKKYSNLSGGLALIHEHSYDNIEDIIGELNACIPVKYNIVYFSQTSRRYHRRFDPQTIVGLDDYFSAQVRNADFKVVDESDFSEEHLFFKQDGFIGFSDFLTIGDNYTEGGFLPYAVAIHLSFNTTSNKIKIKHFVSDSNDDPTNVAGKFMEALTKLLMWCEKNNFTTPAVEEFMNLYQTGHFPGLGSIKKLSIENHIELVLKLI